MTTKKMESEYYSEYGDYDYSDVLYSGFSFERPIYVYIWELLVIVTCLCNVVVISVLVRKKMRSPTYIILVAISLSDSLTGIVTLPTYIGVFQHYHKAESTSSVEIPTISNISNINTMNLSDYELDYFDRISRASVDRSNIPTHGYFISEELCDWFMISKFFLSKSFHTLSVWLTLLLGFWRFLTVYGHVGIRHFTMKKTIISCVCVSVLAPWLHVYHLFKDHSPHHDCKWVVPSGTECNSDCIYLWCVLMFGHLLPAILLILFTGYIVYRMRTSTAELQHMSDDCNSTVNTGLQERQNENRRISRVVIAILVVFLIPEVPYACFMLYIAISAHAELDTDLKSVRAIHAAYEILLVLSFNANFYIYTFINQKFRKVLKETVILPVYKTICCCGTVLGFPDQARNSTSMTGGNITEMTVLHDADKKDKDGRTGDEESQPLQ